MRNWRLASRMASRMIGAAALICCVACSADESVPSETAASPEQSSQRAAAPPSVAADDACSFTVRFGKGTYERIGKVRPAVDVRALGTAEPLSCDDEGDGSGPSGDPISVGSVDGVSHRLALVQAQSRSLFVRDLALARADGLPPKLLLIAE